MLDVTKYRELSVTIEDGRGDLADKVIVSLSDGLKSVFLMVFDATPEGRREARIYRSGVADGIYYARYSETFASAGKD